MSGPARSVTARVVGARAGAARVVGTCLVALVALVGVVVAAPAPPAAASTVRSVGSDAVDDVVFAAIASARPDCGLSADRLAAMLLAPVFHETGAASTPGTSPSPMTLGRWDDQAALFAFGDRATTYRQAFWHAGVGMWQFDSAGGWNMTAADAISTRTSANQAAATMASRYCASTSPDPVARMTYAWSLWYACVAGGRNVCVDRFNEMFVNAKFTNVRPDPTVGRLGGMVPTTCRVGLSTQVACHRVDPARAEGLRSWAAPGAGPTPITAPFYVFARDGREYRYWLPVDTGYPRTVIAHKPIRANARTSLTWALGSTDTGLCDLGTGRGACGTPRVATTPWGDRTAEPFGSVDLVRAGAEAIDVAGWSIDPDTSDPISVHIYVDGGWGGSHVAGTTRRDVGSAVPGYGDNHGYSVRLTQLAPGNREVCVYAINVGPFGSTNPLLGCRTVTVSARPLGNIDGVWLRPGGVTAVGWAGDADAAGALGVEVVVDGAVAATGTTGLARADVGRAVPAMGGSTGYRVDVSVPPGPSRRTVCVDAVDAPTGERIRLRCTDVAFPASGLASSIDLAATVPGGVRLAGWAIDTSTAAPVPLQLVVGGRVVATTTANGTRADVGRVWPGFGDARGFDLSAAVGTGRVEVCVVAPTVGSERRPVTLGCRTLDAVAGNPIGNLDLAAGGPGQVRVAGWTLDPDVADPTRVHVYVAGSFAGELLASTSRPDVGRRWPSWGEGRGFDGTFAATPGGGPQPVCVFAINAGPGTANTLLGCRTVDVPTGNPWGNLDLAAAGGGSVRVAGWAIDPDVADAVGIHVYVGGRFAGETLASGLRTDVGRVWPGWGVARGFDVRVPATPGGPQPVCVFALNVGPGTANTLLGCAPVSVPPPS